MMDQSEKGSKNGFALPHVIRRNGSDGVIYLESGYALPDHARCVGDWIVHWAETRPDTVFLAERNAEGEWDKLTYADLLLRILDLAGWLLENDASQSRPVAILSENAIDHAVVGLAAIFTGIPVATVSPAYSLISSDHAKLKSMIELLDPSLIYVSDIAQFGPALQSISQVHRGRILTSKGDDTAPIEHTVLTDASRPESSSAVAAAAAQVTPDTVARLLFTSGSTGAPKAARNTHRMLTSNQEALRVLWPFLETEPPIIADWLPWSHTFGGNFTTNMVLRNGGSIYIDDGKPAPGAINATIRNFKEIRPNLSFNVPRGYDFLFQALQDDAELRRVFFDMKVIFSAAAALQGNVWDGLIDMSRKETGHVVPIMAAWGSTETAPLATLCHFLADSTGNIGVPVPGVSLKLIPNAGKMEIRVKGPNVTPGYYKDDELTQDAFDDEGYYKMGDAVRLADEDDPGKGLFFDGRVSEDFKLSSGTWVSAGALRVAGVDALAPLAQDIVVAGHNRSAVGFLIFPNEAACRARAGLPGDAPLADVLAHPSVTKHVAEGLNKLKSTGGGSSRHAARARFLLTPPDLNSGEITDKAYLNQRQCLANRTRDVETLYGEDAKQFITPA